MAAKFLCCLPLRLGVLLFTLFQFLVCGAAGAFFWWAYYVLRNHKEGNEQIWQDLPQDAKIILIVAASIYTFSALVGFLGFLGAIFKKEGFVRTFFGLLITIFLLLVGSNIWYLVIFYRFRNKPEEDCLLAGETLGRIEFCSSVEKLKEVHQGWIWASVLVPMLVMIYVIYVVHHYIKRIQKQKNEKTFAASKGIYQPVKGKEETHPLTQPATTYPYSDSANAFGSNSAPKAAPTAYAPKV